MAEPRELNTPANAPEVPIGRIGTPAGSVFFSEDGLLLEGGAARWVDLRSKPTTASHTGPRAPELVVVANDGNVGNDFALELVSSRGLVPSYPGLDSTDEYTVEMWIRPDSVDRGVLWYRSGFIELEISWQDLKIQVDNSWTMYAPDCLTAGQLMHIAVTVDYFDNRSYVYVYVNGQEVHNGSMWGYQLQDSNNDVYIGQRPDGSNQYDGVLDNITCYNVALTAGQVLERYNEGAGTTSLPTGITEQTDITMLLECNEGTGATTLNSCTLGSGFNMALSGVEGTAFLWVTGLLGIVSGSMGVKALAFPAGRVTEIDGSEQLPHEWVEGTTIYPHAHFMVESTEAGNILFRFEYLWVDVNGVVGSNSIVLSTTVANNTVERTHRLENIPNGGLDGAGHKISSIIQYCFARVGTDASDTYPGTVYISEFDIHALLNTMGSKTLTTK